MTNELKNIIINDIETEYMINSKGEVYSNKTNRFLKIHRDIEDRAYVVLSLRKGILSQHRLNRLLYSTFVGDIPKNMTVDHIDEDPTNDSLDNLQILSREDNVRKAITSGKKFNKINIEDLSKICRLLSQGVHYKEIHSMTMISKKTISRIAKGEIYKYFTKDMIFPKSTFDSRVIVIDDDMKNEIKYDITNGMTNEEIYSKYINDIPSIKSSEKIIINLRRELKIPDPRFFKESFILKIEELVKLGKRNDEILTIIGEDYSKRIGWLISRIRTKLNIYNDFKTPKNNQLYIRQDIVDGISNSDIIKKYNLSRDKYTINLLGRLRQCVKKEGSTTIEMEFIFPE